MLILLKHCHLNSANCDGYITRNECEKSLKLMGNYKSPGLDGLPIEFYKTFWSDISNIVINSFNESYDNPELSESQKCAVLTLIFKKGDSALLKNYRPKLRTPIIDCLLSHYRCDYKKLLDQLLAKNRLDTFHLDLLVQMLD